MSATERTRRRNVTQHTSHPEQVVPATPTRPQVTKRDSDHQLSAARSPTRQLIRQGLLAIGLCLFLFGAWNVCRSL